MQTGLSISGFQYDAYVSTRPGSRPRKSPKDPEIFPDPGKCCRRTDLARTASTTTLFLSMPSIEFQQNQLEFRHLLIIGTSKPD